MASHCLGDTVWTCAAAPLVLPGELTVRSVPNQAHLSTGPSVPEGQALPTEEIFLLAGPSTKVDTVFQTPLTLDFLIEAFF